MNKVFVFGLLVLVAACAAAPAVVAPVEAMPTDFVKQIAVAPEVDLPAHEQTKRAILYRTHIGSPYYPAGGLADYPYRYAPYSAYPSTYSYYPYGGYAI